MEFELKQTKRRSISIEVTRDLQVIVRAPKRMSRGEILRFVSDHEDWVQRHKAAMERRNASRITPEPISEADKKALYQKAKEVIPTRVAYFAPLIGVDYGRITIRNQKTRWGSCSTLGNLNFNVALMLVPPELLDYVVVHELCHRLEMNHSPRFWAEVERILPDYKARRKALRSYSDILI
ncbi:MAG: M48 family metallopeptidase [Lachnospiraceae bacterium]|nr:M48 family metallopeptidase [Lachnospiraceae bacterium]